MELDIKDKLKKMLSKEDGKNILRKLVFGNMSEIINICEKVDKSNNVKFLKILTEIVHYSKYASMCLLKSHNSPYLSNGIILNKLKKDSICVKIPTSNECVLVFPKQGCAISCKDDVIIPNFQIDKAYSEKKITSVAREIAFSCYAGALQVRTIEEIVLGIISVEIMEAIIKEKSFFNPLYIKDKDKKMDLNLILDQEIDLSFLDWFIISGFKSKLEVKEDKLYFKNWINNLLKVSEDNMNVKDNFKLM